jgi:hypothetical protein
MESIVIQPERAKLAGRVIAEGKVVEIVDALADPDYKLMDAQKWAGIRTRILNSLFRTTSSNQPGAAKAHGGHGVRPGDLRAEARRRLQADR